MAIQLVPAVDFALPAFFAFETLSLHILNVDGAPTHRYYIISYMEKQVKEFIPKVSAQ